MTAGAVLNFDEGPGLVSRPNCPCAGYWAGTTGVTVLEEVSALGHVTVDMTAAPVVGALPAGQ